MEFTKQEKEVLRDIVQSHLDEVQQNERFLYTQGERFGIEIRYDIFLKGILAKLR
jgi:hypothetical protein